ncbi:hypothetical protein ZWY2020_036324 [Hordeum vulgare]|nr:hypothetical protein ZWY2020_036324 [Hordeum vulgare]
MPSSLHGPPQRRRRGRARPHGWDAPRRLHLQRARPGWAIDEGGEEDVYAVRLAGAGYALGPVPLELPSSAANAILAANNNGRLRLSMECHAVADAAGRTAGALGLRPLLGAPARFLGGSISAATGLRGTVVVGALDLGDGDGEGEEDVTDELRFQDAHRHSHTQAILHLTCLRSRIKSAVHMAEIQYSILYTETWRAVERDHPIYDHIPYTLRKLIEILDEISANINFACFKRAGPWVIQRMVENHALALLHLEDVLLDFDEVLATGLGGQLYHESSWSNFPCIAALMACDDVMLTGGPTFLAALGCISVAKRQIICLR